MQQQKALFADAFLYQPSIIKRLATGFAEASQEFRQNPKAFVTGALKGDGVGGRLRQDRLMLGFAVAMFVFASIVAAMLIAFWIKHHNAGAQEELAVVDYKLTDIAPIDMPKMEKKAGGGGGGGRNAPTPQSKGQLPKFSLTPPIIAPRPEPQLRPPSLPVQETIQVDPRLEPPRIADMPTGDPKGVPGPPSPGPGTGGGIGTGSGGGIGSGDGTGAGPGHGYNMGGGDPRLGGGDRNAVATVVDQKPVPLNSPQPRYTEEARKNKIQGVVIARVLVGADGAVKQARIVRGLPDGLDEQAIQAAYQLRFRPAMKSGQPIAFWVPVQIEFNLR
ncbi:MAG TPA: TonB family protein [Blastocatellia bacterium]|nr:TonB family protein [Blastocatellia bacterium]